MTTDAPVQSAPLLSATAKMIDADARKVGQQRQRDHDAALSTYRALLARAHDPQPGDAEALAKALATLGIQMNTAERHAAAVARVRELEGQTLTDEAQRQAADEIRKLTDQEQIEREKHNRAFAPVREVVDRRRALENGLKSAQARDAQARQEIENLRRECWQAFAGPRPAPLPNPNRIVEGFDEVTYENGSPRFKHVPFDEAPAA